MPTLLHFALWQLTIYLYKLNKIYTAKVEYNRESSEDYKNQTLLFKPMIFITSWKFTIWSTRYLMQRKKWIKVALGWVHKYFSCCMTFSGVVMVKAAAGTHMMFGAPAKWSVQFWIHVLYKEVLRPSSVNVASPSW